MQLQFGGHNQLSIVQVSRHWSYFDIKSKNNILEYENTMSKWNSNVDLNPELACNMEPPESKTNQIRQWNKTLLSDETVIYSCEPKSKTKMNTTIQVATCNDILGWLPNDIVPCFSKYFQSFFQIEFRWVWSDYNSLFYTDNDGVRIFPSLDQLSLIIY